MTYVEAGKEVKTNGTACTNQECQCRMRDGYYVDGKFCRHQVCDRGEEMTSAGEFLFVFLFYWWRLGLVVTSLLTPTKLPFVGPGYYRDGRLFASLSLVQYLIK